MRTLAFLLLIPPLLCAAAKERNWKVGHITADSSINGSEYIKGLDAPRHTAVDPHVLQIQGDDSLYTASEKHAWKGWCLLIQGEQIKYAVDDSRLFVTGADGQKCQLEILSQQKSPAH